MAASRLNTLELAIASMMRSHSDSLFNTPFYAAGLQRWLNRDRIGEKDGPNLYAHVRNRDINFIDINGKTGWGAPFLPNKPPMEDPISCAVQIKNQVWDQFGWDGNGNPAPGHRPGDQNFRYGHCVANCRVQRECFGGRGVAWAGGVIKEAWDEVEQWLGKGDGWDRGDLDANNEGRNRGRQCPQKSCEEACQGTEG